MFYDLLGYCEYFIKLLTTIWQIFINQKSNENKRLLRNFSVIKLNNDKISYK